LEQFYRAGVFGARLEIINTKRGKKQLVITKVKTHLIYFSFDKLGISSDSKKLCP